MLLFVSLQSHRRSLFKPVLANAHVAEPRYILSALADANGNTNGWHPDTVEIVERSLEHYCNANWLAPPAPQLMSYDNGWGPANYRQLASISGPFNQDIIGFGTFFMDKKRKTVPNHRAMSISSLAALLITDWLLSSTSAAPILHRLRPKPLHRL